MYNDYGKMAYVKISQLEDKILNLQKQSLSKTFAVLDFDFTGEKSVNYLEKVVNVNFLSAEMSYVNISCTLEKSSDREIDLNVFFGDEEVYSQSALKDGDNAFDFNALCEKGVYPVKIILSSFGAFNLNNLKLEIKGYVSYNNLEGALSVGSYENKDISCHQYGESASVYEYSNGLPLKKIASFSGVYESQVVMVNGEFAYILVVDTKRNLKLIKINLSNYQTNSIILPVNAVMSACGYPDGNGGITIYFSQLAQIYQGNFASDTAFSYHKTGRKGVKLYAECNEPGVMITVDRNKCAKLVKI